MLANAIPTRELKRTIDSYFSRGLLKIQRGLEFEQAKKIELPEDTPPEKYGKILQLVDDTKTVNRKWNGIKSGRLEHFETIMESSWHKLQSKKSKSIFEKPHEFTTNQSNVTREATDNE